MSLSTFRALGSVVPPPAAESFLRSCDKTLSSSSKNFQQNNEEQQKQRRRYSTSSTSRIPDILRDRKIRAKCNSRPFLGNADTLHRAGTSCSSSSIGELFRCRLFNRRDCVTTRSIALGFTVVGNARRHCVYYSHFYAPYLIKANEGERFNCTRNVRFAGQKETRGGKKACRQGRGFHQRRSRKSSNFQRRFRNVTNS